MSETEDLREAIARALAGYTWQSDKAADAVLALPQVAELRGKTRDSDGDLFAQIDALLSSGDYGNVTDRLVEFVTAREAGLRAATAEWEETADWLGIQRDQFEARAEAAEGKVERCTCSQEVGE